MLAGVTCYCRQLYVDYFRRHAADIIRYAAAAAAAHADGVALRHAIYATLMPCRALSLIMRVALLQARVERYDADARCCHVTALLTRYANAPYATALSR